MAPASSRCSSIGGALRRVGTSPIWVTHARTSPSSHRPLDTLANLAEGDSLGADLRERDQSRVALQGAFRHRAKGEEANRGGGRLRREWPRVRSATGLAIVRRQKAQKGWFGVPKGLDISSSTPDVTSFDIDPTLQRFALLGCDGLWTAFAGLQAVEWLNERLPKMDSRRTEIAKTLDEPASASALTQAELAALKAERESVCEEGLLKAMLHEAVHVRHAKDNVTVVLVRLPEL